MNIDRRLMLLGIMIIVLSMTMATQYAVTKIGYSYTIAHPSEEDIRFIGSDNSSDDGDRVLRVLDNATPVMTIELGDWAPNTNNTYTAAFGIVNEEQFAVNITYIEVIRAAGNTSDYLQIWLHGNATLNVSDDSSSVFMYDNGTMKNSSATTAWTLGRGDGDTSTMTVNCSSHSAAWTNLTTPWDGTSYVRYYETATGSNLSAYGVGTSGRTVDNASDFVWVQISLNLPAQVDATGAHGGTIWIHFEATTHYGED